MGLLQKKIAFFTIDYSQGGGVEKVTADLTNLFIENGLNVTDLVSLYKGQEKPLMKYHSNLNITVLNPQNKKDLEDTFYQYFKNHKPDIFIFQGDNMSIALAIIEASKKANVIAIPQYHGSPYAYLKKYPDALKANYDKRIWAKILYPFKKNKLKKLICKSTHGFISVSKGVENELRELYNGSTCLQHITTIRNPILLNSSPIQEKEKTVSFISRLERKHKNAFLAVKSWKLIAYKYPDWQMNIYGEGSLKSKMEKYAQENNIRNINFLGFQKNLNERLAKSIITISTSDCEGFSMAVAEAIMNKNAIASTNSDGGIKDMLIHEKTALLSPKNNAKLLSKNIEKLITNNSLREKYIQNAYDNLKKLIDEDIFKQWVYLLQSLTN